jgi:hypothetical protein
MKSKNDIGIIYIIFLIMLEKKYLVKEFENYLLLLKIYIEFLFPKVFYIFYFRFEIKVIQNKN